MGKRLQGFGHGLNAEHLEETVRQRLSKRNIIVSPEHEPDIHESLHRAFKYNKRPRLKPPNGRQFLIYMRAGSTDQLKSDGSLREDSTSHMVELPVPKLRIRNTFIDGLDDAASEPSLGQKTW